MLQSRVFNRLIDIERESWDACFTGEAENYDYLLAVEDAGIAGFEWRYLTLWDDQQLVAAAPLFVTDYRLDTTLQGTGKKITDGLSKTFPKLLTLKLACLGSPCTETVLIGFAANVSDKRSLLKTLLEHFEDYAAVENCPLLGVKDIPEKLKLEFELVFKERKYSALPGMPGATLDINFKTVEEYISSLSQKMRKDLRRKIKSFEQLRVERCENIDDVLPEVLKLYQSTKSRSEWQFEELTQNYFKNVLAKMPGRAFCMLYYAGDELLAANLLIHNNTTLLDKFFCMDKNGRDHNLYFLSWLTNIKLCLEHGFTHYESGQAYGDTKTRLGSRLSPNTMYFKHRNIIMQGILKLVAPLLAADESTETKEAA